MYLEEFLKKNGVDVDGFIEENARRLLKVYELYDDGIANFAIYDSKKDDVVNIADVIGIPNYLAKERGFLDNFCIMFDPLGDTYHSRANGMLEYSSDEVVEKLEKSFREEPIKLSGIGDKYFLGGNGNHRIHLFLMHYLMDSYKGVDVDNKYKIPAVVQRLDCIKTYANFIGSLLWDESFTVKSDYDGFVRKTGKARVTYHGERMVFTDEELVNFLRERMEALKNLDEDYYIDVIKGLWVKYNREESGLFKTFIGEHLPELEHVLNVEDFADLENEVKTTLLGGVNYGNN